MYKFLSLILLLLSIPCHAQMLSQQVPEALAVKHGVLKNGMSYYIGKIPKEKKCSFYIVQRTGSLIEQDDERGLAHFVEHLLFYGTKNYKNNAIIDYIRSLGSDIGKDLNAGTSHEYTFYQLENITAWNDSIINNCLLMLRDMMYEAELNDKDIEKERNVIIEEALMGNNMDSNISFFKETPYQNPIIGDTSIIRNCPAEKIRNFYHHWYQPQLQAIIVMLPYDTDTVLSMIKDVFEIIPKGNTVAPKRTSIPTLREPRVNIIHDKTKENGISINLKLLQQQAEEPRNTIDYYLKNTVLSMYTMPIALTYEQLDSLGIACSVSLDKWNNSLLLDFTAKSDNNSPLSVLKSFLSILKSIRRFRVPDGIPILDQAELTKTNNEDCLQWEPADNILSSSDYSPGKSVLFFALSNPIFEKCRNNFLYGEPILDSKTEAQIDLYLRERMKEKDLQKIFNQFFVTSNHYYDITIPQNVDLTENEVLDIIKEVDEAEATRLHISNNKTEKQLIIAKNKPSEIIEGEIVSDILIAGDSVREIMLSNGVKVLIDKGNNSVYNCLKAYRNGGLGLLDLAQRTKFDILQSSFLENKQTLVSHRIESSHDLYELSCIYNWEEALKALYEELTDTHLDTSAFRGAWAKEWNNEKTESVRILRRSLSIPTQNIIQLKDSVPTDADLAETQHILNDFKSNYNGMVVAIDCTSDENSIIPYIKKYIGSLPSKLESSPLFDYDYFIKKDSTLTDILMGVKQDVIILSLFQEQNFAYTPDNFILHKATELLLEKLIIDSIRLNNGEIYTFSVRGGIEQFSHPHQFYNITLACAPDKTEKIINDLEQLLHNIVYGNKIKEVMIDNCITELRANGSDYPTESKAVRIMNKIRQQGVVIDISKMNVEEVVTIDAIKFFLKNLLEHGHCLRYKLSSKGEANKL